MDISYGWILRKSANFHCHDIGATSNINSDMMKYHLGLLFYRTFISKEELSYDFV